MRIENISYPYFFTVSLALHLALVPLIRRNPFSVTPTFEPIEVSFLADGKPLEEQKTQTAAPLPSQRRGERAQAKHIKRAAIVAKKPTPAPTQPAPQTADLPLPADLTPRTEQTARPFTVEPPPQVTQPEPTRGPLQGEASIFKDDAREQPVTKSDLLPGRRELVTNHRAIPLNTSDVRYASYTQSVKQWIEARWEYPDLAKHYGLQGRVVVEFTILQNGHIEFLALVRSSGSKLLDEEAVRAIKAAVPFKPFPRSIQESSLRIIAGFIYSDQRVVVSGTP